MRKPGFILVSQVVCGLDGADNEWRVAALKQDQGDDCIILFQDGFKPEQILFLGDTDGALAFVLALMHFDAQYWARTILMGAVLRRMAVEHLPHPIGVIERITRCLVEAHDLPTAQVQDMIEHVAPGAMSLEEIISLFDQHRRAKVPV